MPKIMEHGRFHDLNKEPLLHCFTVLVREKLAELDPQTVTRNAIYDNLISDLFDRNLDGDRPR